MVGGGHNPKGQYDVIVLGVGGMGSATCHQLALRGKRVLGIERFDIPHSLGSSHGVTRIIRQAYYEHPSYVPLLRRSYALWRELERGYGERLLHITGSVDASAPDEEVFRGSYDSCQMHDIPHEVLTSAELSKRFPGYRLPARPPRPVSTRRRLRALRASDRRPCPRGPGSWRRNPRPRAGAGLGRL